MSESSSEHDGPPTLREYYKVTPSTGSETTADVDSQITSLLDLRKALSEDEKASGILGRFLGGKTADKVTFSFIATSAGPDEPVELYYTADGKLNTLGSRLRSIYPDTFDIERVTLDITEALIKPVRLEKMEFITRLVSGQLNVSPEEVCDEIKWRDSIQSVDFSELQVPAHEPAVRAIDIEDLHPELQHSTDIVPEENTHPGYKALALGLTSDLPPEAYRDEDELPDDVFYTAKNAESDEESEPRLHPFHPLRIDPDYLPDDLADRDIPDAYPYVSDDAEAPNNESPAGDTADNQGADAGGDAPLPVSASASAVEATDQTEGNGEQDDNGEQEQDSNQDDDSGSIFDGDNPFENEFGGDSYATAGAGAVGLDDEDEKVSIQFDYDAVSGTALVDPATKLFPHIGGDNSDDVEWGDGEDEQSLPPVASANLDRPTLGPNGDYVYVRPDPDYMIPKATRWYGQEETIKDWMTTLKTATESNPEYESESEEDTDIESPETVETLLETLEEATVPTAYQVVFQARDDWSDAARQRKKNIRSGEFSKHWFERHVIGGYETDEDRDLKAYEYRRIKLIENKRPKKTFNTNVRALSLVPHDQFEKNPDNPAPTVSEDRAAAEEAVGELKPLFDPLDGIYYHPFGERVPQDSARGTDLTAQEVADNFLNHELVTREDRRKWYTKFNIRNDPKKRPELILNADELSDFIIIPSGEELAGDAYRSAGTTDEDANHLRRPRPEIHKKLTGGMDIGYAFDEDGIPEDEPTSIPENKLTNHWLKVGSSGSGKTINTIGMMLSLYDNVDGPVILVDPKSGDMVENYAKSHAARFGDLRDVKIFEVPDVLPAIPFFDIRPHLHEGMKRDDAIQQKVDEFDMIMHMIDDNYGNAYVAKSVLGALIKSQFDARHGADSFTLDELYDAAVEMYADQTIPRVSHQPQVERILSNQLTNTEQDFKNTMQAVINRLDDLQEDINLYRLFNQNPEWDDDDGKYLYNRKTQQEYEEEKEDDTVIDPEPPHTALDFRELLDTDDVVLFDTGDFVRNESQKAFSMYVLSALWSAVKSRYNDRDSHEEIDNTANLIIEESAPIVSTELVTNTLIPEGREFGLSLGMVMQFPEQVRKHSDAETYNEIITNVQSKIIGQIEPGQRIVESLVHGDRDKQAIKNKINLLSSGEWIADLPEPEFGSDVPPPFSIQSLGVPPGHPEGKQPFSPSGRDTFYRQYTTRKARVKNKHGHVPPSAEEIADANAAGETTGFNQGDDNDEQATTTPGVPDEDETDSDSADKGSSSVINVGDEDNADEVEVDVGTAMCDDSAPKSNSGTATDPADNSDSDFTDSEQVADDGAAGEQAAREDTAPAETDSSESTGEGTQSLDPSTDDPDFGDHAPLPRERLEEICGEITIDRDDQLANIAQELRTNLPDEEYYCSLLTLSQIAAGEGHSITPGELHESVKAQADSGEVNADTTKKVSTPTGEKAPHASDVDDDESEASADDNTDDREEAVNASGTDASTDDAATESESANSDQTGSGDGDADPSFSQRLDNADIELPDSDGNLAENIIKNMSNGTETSEGEQETTDTEDSDEQDVPEAGNEELDIDIEEEAEADAESEHPATVTLDVPLSEAYADFNLDRYDDREFSDDDKQFISFIAAAFRNELDWYSLTDSMTGVRDRAGEPDVESLMECGYIDDGKIGNRKYYSLTRKGWRTVSDTVPGNDFGDHMEKMPHRVGVHLLANHIADREDVSWTEEYARYNGETYDVIGYDSIGSVVVTGEVETESNNPTAVAEDYEKLSEAPGDVIWAHPSERAFSDVWKKLNQEVFGESLTARAMDRTAYFEDYLQRNDFAGVDAVVTYATLKEDS